MPAKKKKEEEMHATRDLQSRSESPDLEAVVRIMDILHIQVQTKRLCNFNTITAIYLILADFFSVCASVGGPHSEISRSLHLSWPSLATNAVALPWNDARGTIGCTSPSQLKDLCPYLSSTWFPS